VVPAGPEVGLILSEGTVGVVTLKTAEVVSLATFVITVTV
jgi:hypothetical protein